MQEPPQTPKEFNPEPPVAPMSLTGRLFNIFATPSEVFDDIIRRGPTPSNWLVPGLLIVVTGVVFAWLVLAQPAVRQQLHDVTSRAVEEQIANGKIPEAKAEQARAAAEKYGSIGTTASLYVTPVFVGFGVPFFWGLLLWIGARLVFKNEISYMKAVEAAGLAGMITWLETIVRNLLVLVTGNLFASPSLMLLVLDEFNPQKPLHAILGIINVMVLWLLVVRAIGLARLANVSGGKAALWVFGLWIAYTGGLTGLGFAISAAFK